MSGEQTKSSIWKRGPFVFGVVLTFIVVAFGAFVLFEWPQCSSVGPCRTNWDVLRFHSGPNEIGDFLAGFAGTLAFVWLVVTVLLQASELREQREQFSKMASAQEAQVELLVQQGKIFSEEQRQRSEESAGKILRQELELLASEIGRARTRFVVGAGSGPHFASLSGEFIVGRGGERLGLMLFPPCRDVELEEQYTAFYSYSVNVDDSLQQLLRRDLIDVLADNADEFDDLLGIVDSIIWRMNFIGEADERWTLRLRIPETMELFKKLRSLSIWSVAK